MRKLFVFLLIGCICIGMVACGEKPGETSGTNGDITASTPDASYPEQTMEVLQYLKDKYDTEFLCVGYTNDNTTFHCVNDALGGVVLVHKVDALVEDGVSASYFNGKYADNGYLAMAREEIHRYYDAFFTMINERKVLIQMSCDYLPSAVNDSKEYLDNRKTYPDFFKPSIYVLCDETVLEETVQNIRDLMAVTGEDATVYIISHPQSRWDSITIDELVWTIEDFKVIHQFTTKDA